MKKKCLPLLFAAISILAVACKSNNKSGGQTDTTAKVAITSVTPQSQTAGGVTGTDEYTVNVPDGWQHAERQLKNYKMLLLAAPKDGDYQPNLTVLKDDMRGQSMEAYIAMNLKQMEPMHIKLDKTGDLDVDGFKGKFMTYTYDYQGKSLTIKSYILPKDNVAYILTGSSLASQSDKMMPVFDETVNSFKLK